MQRMGVIGIGNEAMGDDGIAPLLIRRLKTSSPFGSAVCFIDGGTGGMRIVHELAKLDIAVILDAGDFGGEPGEFRIFSPEEAVSLKPLSGLSVHEWDLIKTIEISRIMEELPEQLYIMAIQPERISGTQKLSRTLEALIPQYETAVLKLLHKIKEAYFG